LKSLSNSERAIVRDFGVDTFTFVPSVYPASNLTFDKAGSGITIETEKRRYFQSITEEVNKATTKGGSAIVFFETDERLTEFKKSEFWSRFRHGNVLSSATNKETRNFVIKKAATSKQVTIATTAFGRGTDFFCKDKKLEDAGGMVVIQTFLSVEKSEETQIKGRTARQGKRGVYSMVLLESDLCEKFEIAKGECADYPLDKRYDFLDGRRVAVHTSNLSELVEKVGEAEELDLLSRGYLDALVKKDVTTSRDKLEVMYKSIKKARRQLKFSRMVCLSDATGSMSGIWGATRDCITEMLRRIDEIGEGQFELLWIAYRDYSDGAGLLEASSWTKDPHELVRFVSTIKCTGGGDYPEAVEWALKAVNEEHAKKPVTRALLIADAPPHFETRGSTLPSHGDRVMSTDYKHESEQLMRNEIPVYTFRLNNEEQLVRSFDEIASITGGESSLLDFSSDGANTLIDVVCETALDDIGGSELRAEYKARKWE